MTVKMLAAGAVVFPAVLAAQSPPPPPPPQDRIQVFTTHVGGPGVVMAGAPADNIQFIAAEFGFDAKVVKGTPYSADAVTESTQVLADGNRIARKNTAQLYRDSEGRTRRDQEMENIGPWASKGSFKSSVVHDPVADLHFVLEPAAKIARKLPSGMKLRTAAPGNVAYAAGGSVSVSRMPAPAVAIAEEGVRTDGPGEAVEIVPRVEHFEAPVAAAPATGPTTGFQNESLGTKVIAGVVAEGTKSTLTIPAGQIGNERPIEVVSERWYSPELQTVVMTRRNDPRMGETVYKLTNIRRSEPLKQLFEIPPDYAVQESNTRMPHVEVLRTKEAAPRQE
jgi:hypothetical protein